MILILALGRAARTTSRSADRWRGLLLDITGWAPEAVADGVALMSDRWYYGPGGRSLYT